MAKASDTYTSAQAAQILGVSERRVRQLVTEGKLNGSRGDDGVVRIAQRSVNEERKKRKGTAQSRAAGRAPRRAKGADTSVDVEQLAEKVASAVGTRLEGQLEITRRAESLVRDELDEERARRVQAEAKLAAIEGRVPELEEALADAERRVAELEVAATRRRGLFRR